MTCRYCSGLYDDTDDKDSSCNQDAVLSGQRFCHESRQQCTKPCTKLEDRGKPALSCGIGWVVAVIVSHMRLERRHGQDTREYALVVAYTMLMDTTFFGVLFTLTIEKTSNTSKHCNHEYTSIFDESSWATLAHECLATK
jgi:hypothetical protein